MKIFYIAGHGAGDPGAVGCNYEEAERVRTFGKRLKELGGDNVMLSDFNRDYFADRGIERLNLDPNEWVIVEGHMDAGSPTARGGHVIIQAPFEPDDYDNALASLLKTYLPGRANMIVKRDNLNNPYLASIRGYNYRLVEFGFITNWDDVKIFNEKMDLIALGVLNAFGIGSERSGSDMLCYIQCEGKATQYLYDGFRMKGVRNIPAKNAITKVIKAAGGGDPKTIILTPQEFEYVKEMTR